MDGLARGASEARRSAVCFGGATAIGILRAVDAAFFEPMRGGSKIPTKRVPAGAEIAAAIGRLEAVGPYLALEGPVQVFAQGLGGARPTALRVLRRCNARLSANSLLKFNRDIYVSSPELAFVQVAAHSKSVADLSQLAFELCGAYQTER